MMFIVLSSRRYNDGYGGFVGQVRAKVDFLPRSSIFQSQHSSTFVQSSLRTVRKLHGHNDTLKIGEALKSDSVSKL